MLPSLRKRLHSVQKVGLCFFIAVKNRLPWVLREDLVFDNELVKVISEKVSARVAPVPIEYAKEATFWPIDYILLRWWLHDVEHNAHSVLVVVTNDALIGVGGVAHYVAVFSHAALSRLPAGKIEGGWVGRSTVTK